MRILYWQSAFASISTGNIVHVVQAERRASLNLKKLYGRVAIIATAILFIDQLSKYLALRLLGDQPEAIIGDFLRFNLARNSGAAFSLATGSSIALASFGFAFLMLTLVLLRHLRNFHWALVSGLVLGGLLGNLVDRVFRSPGLLRGSVVDWIELPHWPIFNLADVSLVSAAFIATILTFKGVDPRVH